MSLLKGTRVTWLGHATVLVELTNGTNLLIDPFLEHNPKFPKGFVLPKIDTILLTHAHMDHTLDTIPVATKDGSKVVAMVELADYYEGKGLPSTVGINLGGTVHLPGVDVTMVEAKHSSSIVDDGKTLYMGEAGGLVLTIENGPVLYHAGDTTVFRDMELIQELYAPDVAMLPIGGHYTMGPKEAALAVRYLQPRLVLPLHWGTFPPLVGKPSELAALVNDPALVAMISPGDVLPDSGV
jgi:L-ascorbate metabolism protein UlaG (beta-lactamase superfamily)